MRLRLPVIAISAVILLLGGILTFSGPFRIGGFVLRSPIDILQQAARRALGLFLRSPTATSVATLASRSVNDVPDEGTAIVASTVVSAPRGVPRQEAFSQDTSRRTGGVSSGAQVPDRLGNQPATASSRTSRSSSAAQPRPGSNLPVDTTLPGLIPGGAPPVPGDQPPVGQPPIGHPPTDIAMPGLPGGPTLPALPPTDGIVPPGGVLPPGVLPPGALPPGTILSPGSIGQLPGAVQPPGGVLPVGSNPGGVSAPGGINPGAINPGGINPGGINPGGVGGINPGGINPGGVGGVNPGGVGGVNPGGINPGGIVPGGVLP